MKALSPKMVAGSVLQQQIHHSANRRPLQVKSSKTSLHDWILNKDSKTVPAFSKMGRNGDPSIPNLGLPPLGVENPLQGTSKKPQAGQVYRRRWLEDASGSP